MGYNITMEDGSIDIPNEHLEAVYVKMCTLNDLPDEYKNGGAYSGGKRTGAWFSWMPADYPNVCRNAQEILEELGFTCRQTSEYLVADMYDSKVGQEKVFIAAIAPWIDEPCEVYWVGEDGARWKWTFDHGVMIEHEGHLTYVSREIVL